LETKLALILTLVFALAFASTVISQEVFHYVSLIEIHVDGFICATCVRTLEETLRQEKGIVEVIGDLERGTLRVVPEMDGRYLDLFSIRQRINSIRQYTVIEMEISVVGEVVKYPAEYYIGGLYAYSGDRYKLKAGDTEFILAANEKLTELLSSEQKVISATGTVTSFQGDQIPVMQLTEFHKPRVEEIEKWKQTVVVPNHVGSIRIYVDGYISNASVRYLEKAVNVEEGVSEVKLDTNKNIITVIPQIYGRQVDLSDLWDNIDNLDDYTVRKIDVFAVGNIVKFPARYYNSPREYTHSEDRYKLQIKDDYFFALSRNDELDKLINAGYGRATVRGTVSAFSSKVPIMVIADFEKPLGEEPSWARYSDPLDKLGAMLVGEEIKKAENPTQLEPVRIYVDGFICAACERALKDNILQEEGVQIVNMAPELGLIEVIPKDVEIFELHDLWQRINAMREYKVLKMDAVATGKLQEIEVEYGEETASPERIKRYKFSAGPLSFALSYNPNLAQMLRAKDKIYTVLGTITAFNVKVPILEIKSYKEVKEMPDWLKPDPF
jgi:copper chaperone CopZ